MLRSLPIVALLLLGSCGLETRGPLQLQLGHVANPGSLTDDSAQEFARRANAKLAGRAHINVFGSSQLGDDQTLLLKLKLGTVDFSVPSTVMSTAVDAFGFFEMPYLVEDREHLKRIREEIFWSSIAPRAEPKGYRMLAVWENGFRQITNNRHPIVRPEDLAGIKLRTPRGRWRLRLFQSYGASPTPMSLSEVFVALQTGVIDGQENPLSQIYSSQLHEVQKYLSLTNHVYSPAFLAVGVERWESLPEDVRAPIVEAALETQDWVLSSAAQIDRDLLAKLETEGMAVNAADREAFVAASQTIYREFGAEVEGGAEWIERALALGSH
ncbi:MAG: DctP family TRAP transporter solute-binding subunit [Acidobacteria bacterium]|nr:DctP family TRAP transporter solute-binding subunit [Acidobacteriota bacterium]